jgi:hypothetical protein
MEMNELPMQLGGADTEGINNVLYAIVHDEQSAKDFAALLQANPRGVIRRTVALNRYQQAALSEMSDDEVHKLVAPVIKSLRGPDPVKHRAIMTERIETHSPLHIKCGIEINT